MNHSDQSYAGRQQILKLLRIDGKSSGEGRIVLPSGFGLDGNMIPRRVKRLFDQREEERAEVDGVPAKLSWRGLTLDVRLANLSSSGAMVICDEVPNIGERVALQLPDRRAAPADVTWVRDGRIGIHFAAPLE